MTEQIKLLGLTAVLTILVWWSADSLVTETVNVSAVFDVRAAGTSSDMLVMLSPETPAYTVGLSGPRKTMEEIQARTPLRIKLMVGDMPRGSNLMVLDRSVLKQALVDQRSEFRKVSVTSVQPADLPITVDHMLTREVFLVARRLALAYDVEPQLQRSAVRARLRSSHLDTVSSDQPLQYEIGPELERILRDQPPGKSVTVPLKLDASRFGPGGELTPGTVEVTATVKSQRVTAQIPTVPILFACSPANLEKAWRPVNRDGEPLPLITQTITVSGTPEDVARLQRGESRVYGIVHLKEEDVEAGNVLKIATPDFRLPKGVDLAQEPVPIEFKLLPAGRDSAGG